MFIHFAWYVLLHMYSSKGACVCRTPHIVCIILHAPEDVEYACKPAGVHCRTHLCTFEMPIRARCATAVAHSSQSHHLL